MSLLVYLLKVILVSAIFFGYYRLFLRNKRFHHYNRFFLLSALLLSIVLPFIRIPLLYQPDDPVNEAVYRTVSVINTDYGEEELAMTEAPAVSESVFTLVNSIYLVYAIGALFLLTLVTKSLLYISSLRKRYPAEKITSLRFYNTHEPGTPFSFFRSIFWNDQLPFNSHEGQQIFRHELFHVQHRHSADRLLSELLTAVFWFNPFFHLIKKELKAIHEFLADQFAISESDRYAYASLLVQQALESGKHTVTNHFFQNHIKRRIAMITQFQKSNYGYWSRVMILPVSLLLFFAITLYAKKPNPGAGPKMAAAVMEQPLTVLVDVGHGGTDNGVTSQDGSVREKDLTLQISRKIQELAARMNINVVMSRDGDYLAGNKANGPDALRYTTSLITELKPDAVVSVHIGTVYAEGAATSSKNGIDIYITDRNKNSLQSSRLLGEQLIGSLSPVYTVNPVLRQRKSKGIWVLDNSAQPTVLIECGYLSNAKDLAFIRDVANQEKIALAILQGIINFKKADPVSEVVTDTIPEKAEKERELQKREAELEMLRKQMQEQESVIRKARMEELEQIKKQMQEQEILSREQEDMKKRRVRELMEVKNELTNHLRQMEKERAEQLLNLEKEMKAMELQSGAQQNPRLEEARKKMELMRVELKNVHESQQKEIQAKLRDIETQSQQQMNIQRERQAELEILKSKLKEREHEMKREQQEKNRVNQDKEREVKEMNRKIQELNREKQEKYREEKKDRKDDDQSGLKPPTTDWVVMTDEWAVRTEDSLLKDVVRHYLRNLRYPGLAMKHSAEGQIYFSVVVDQKGIFKNFNTYTDKPRVNNIQDLVVIGKTPVAVTDENLSIDQAEEIFIEEVERATDRASNKPVVHPGERTYFFRAIFKFDKLNNDNTFRFRNTLSFEKNEEFSISHNSSASFSHSVDQDTIPARKAVKRETKLAAKDGTKPEAKADAKREAKPSIKAKPESDVDAKPALKAKPAREPRDVDAKPHKARTSLFDRKGKEPRKSVFAKRQPSKIFGEKKSSIFKSPKKTMDKPMKPVKAKPVDGSGKIDEQEESEETITVTGEK